MQYKKQTDNTTILPAMLIEESFDRVLFRDVVEAIFATDNRDEAEAVIEEFNSSGMSSLELRVSFERKKKNCERKYTVC